MNDTDRLAAIRRELDYSGDAATFIADEVRWLLDQLEQARAELAATVRAKQENDERFMIDRAEARADRDRARATAVALEQENAAAEEARQVWAKTAQKQVAEVRADLEHERGTSRRLALEVAAMATAIQRVRDEHEESEGTCSSCIGWDERPQPWPCTTITALAGEVPDGN